MQRKALLWTGPAGNSPLPGSDKHLGRSQPGHLREDVEGLEEKSGGRRGMYLQPPNHRCDFRGVWLGRSRKGGGAVAGAGLAVWILFVLVVTLSKYGTLLCVCLTYGEKTHMLHLSLHAVRLILP